MARSRVINLPGFDAGFGQRSSREMYILLLKTK